MVNYLAEICKLLPKGKKRVVLGEGTMCPPQGQIGLMWMNYVSIAKDITESHIVL